MKIAAVGCAHGELETIYSTLQDMEREERIKVDLVLCCGDFQAVRNLSDLDSMACSAKYRNIGSFWKYYCGQEVVPYPTLFVGGNHEASNHLWELFYGGYAAPNIYFLGFAGVIRFGGLRIGGLSGTFNARHYHSGHYERPPYNYNEMKSIYNVREFEVSKLLELKEPLDIVLSHDWPNGIVVHGNKEKLLRAKPFLRAEVEDNALGSTPAMPLLQKLKPQFWFSAHMHVKFAAVVNHPDGGGSTKFLALDKCIVKHSCPRQAAWFQILDVPVGSREPLEFQFDEEWLAITRAYHSYLPLTRLPAQVGHLTSLHGHRQWVKQRMNDEGGIAIPNFAMSAEPYSPWKRRKIAALSPTHLVRNPQTEAFLDSLQLPYTFDSKPVFNTCNTCKEEVVDPDEIQLDDDVDES